MHAKKLTYIQLMKARSVKQQQWIHHPYVGYFQMRDFIKRSPGRCGPLPSPFRFHYSLFKDCLWGQFYTCLRTVSQGARGAV